MKKLKFILLFTLVFFIFGNNCHAKELVEENVPNVWIFKKGGGKKAFSSIYSKYSIDGITTYCVEPGVPITTHEYFDLNGWNSSPYDEEMTKKIQLIGYFGYDYPGHDTLEYRMATQALIWELTGGQIVEYWTEKSGGGKFINIQNERNEIMNLVNSYKKANFDKTYSIVDYGKNAIFTDQNNILNEYEIITDNAKIDGNKIIINQNTFNENKIVLKRKSYTNKVTTLYAGIDESSQKMGYFGLFDEDTITLTAKTNVKAKLKVTKLDSETEEIIKHINFKFKIKNLDTNNYLENEMIFETKNGTFITPFYLEKGNYELEEVKDNYDSFQWNKESLKFIIDENSDYNIEKDIFLEVIYKNNPIKGEVIIYKTGELPFSDEEIKLENVEFELYADKNIYNGNKELLYKKNDLIGKYTTKDGVIKIDNLFVGKYYIKETKTNNDYILDTKKKSFEININNMKIEFNLKNKLKKGIFELTKKDISTKEVIPGATIEIYKENTLVYKGKTNKNGVISVNNLPIGKYKFIESDAPIGYVLNEDEHFFEIKENGEIIKDTLTNEKITGTFELTKKDISSKEVIPGAKITVYDEFNNIYYEGITNDDGKIYLDSIPFGKYKFIESDAPIGYILNECEHYFEIKNNGDTVKDILFNERISIPNTLLNDSYYLSYIFFLLGLIMKTYEKKYI